MMWQWLESRPYWAIYYLVYLAALTAQATVDFPARSREERVTALAIAAGIAFTTTVVVELGVSIMLLIPKTIQGIRAAARRELLDSLVKRQVISEERRKEIEAELKEK